MLKTEAQKNLDELDAQHELLMAKYRRVGAELKALCDLRDAAVDARLAELTDAEILGSADLREWMCREGFSHTGAHHRLKALHEAAGLSHATGAYTETIDIRTDELAERCLPALQLALVRGQQVADLADAIHAWSLVWLMGRDDILVSVREASNAEHGSYGGTYEPQTGVMSLRVRRYGHDSPVKEGDLLEVLQYVARELPRGW